MDNSNIFRQMTSSKSQVDRGRMADQAIFSSPFILKLMGELFKHPEEVHTVLDAGSGEGQYLISIIENYLPNAIGIGFDLDQSAIERAASTVAQLPDLKDRISFMTGDIRKLPLKKGSVRAVLAKAIFPVIQKNPNSKFSGQAEAMIELIEVLDSKGVLLLPDIDLESMVNAIPHKRYNIMSKLRYAAATAIGSNLYWAKELPQLLKDIGFKGTLQVVYETHKIEATEEGRRIFKVLVDGAFASRMGVFKVGLTFVDDNGVERKVTEEDYQKFYKELMDWFDDLIKNEPGKVFGTVRYPHYVISQPGANVPDLNETLI